MPCVLNKILKTVFFCFFVFLFFVFCLFLFVFFKGARKMSCERFYHLLKFLEPLVLKQKKNSETNISRRKPFYHSTISCCYGTASILVIFFLYGKIYSIKDNIGNVRCYIQGSLEDVFETTLIRR